MSCVPEHQESLSHGDNGELAGLVERAGVRRACDLDLMVFFGRHPLSLLSSESLATFLGYDINQVAQSLDDMLAAGVIRRRQTTAHAARLYELLVGGPASEWLGELLARAATRPGRMQLLDEIRRRAEQHAGDAGKHRGAGRTGPRRMTRPHLTST